MVFGEDPREGFRENNVFYHPVLKFQFPIPLNWNYQNTPQRVQMAPKDGKALLMLMLASGNSMQEASNTFVQQNKLSPVETRNITVNGLPAFYLIADLQSQQQGQATLRTMSYFIQYNGTIYHLLGVSALQDFNAYAGNFSTTMQGFRALTDPDKLNKKPERIRIRTVGSAMTLAQFLNQQNIPQARQEEHAVLNGMKLTDNVAQGTLIKIIAL
jgi:predicted Zn-dependent protease